MWREEIKLDFPYDFDYSMRRLAFDDLNKIDMDTKTIYVPISVEEEVVVATVQAIGTIKKPVFLIEGENENQKKAVLAKISELFQWDVDLAQIDNFFKETSLAPLFKKHRYTPIVREFDLFGCLVKVIIHQQLNMAFSQTLTSRFVHTFGHQKNGVWCYPSPKEVAALEYDQLTSLQFSKRKAEYIIDTAKLMVDKQLDLDELAGLPDAEIFDQLLKVRGIGAWTIENWLLFGLGRADLFPKADIAIQQALKNEFELEKRPTYPEMDEWNERWMPYRSYATMTLWRSIED
ncbi:DNA-3-methyladenine glycosylase family protein [Saliterribacillus persicus]|uniref:DNA-3-methyladenine glycosylase II n=1 Tax=Saliterribacillus persicus TaxID=930114 RepID=A0A368XAD1_9BACI|nr:DNA-3-methyladenine glycosylase [Saliterribacillus persicus]RCW62984.1 DNA-3-methyladenine glycosylase II [Saliterribacillus persicus]